LRETQTIPLAQVQRQLQLCRQLRALLPGEEGRRTAFVDTYGCQQNEADSERLRGYLQEMGFSFAQEAEGADLVLLNTCAIRDHAEQRVYGNVGALSHTKRRHQGQLIVLCGCMARQDHVAQRLRTSFPYVDLVFGPQLLWKFPELLWEKLSSGKRVFATQDVPGTVAEGIPQVRGSQVKAWVSIMYGCNNFCSYCIVPYTRGRERSREPEIILTEIRELAEQVGLSYSYLRGRKQKDKWDEAVPPKKRGGQKGNKNSKGKRNAAGSHKRCDNVALCVYNYGGIQKDISLRGEIQKDISFIRNKSFFNYIYIFFILIQNIALFSTIFLYNLSKIIYHFFTLKLFSTI